MVNEWIKIYRQYMENVKEVKTNLAISRRNHGIINFRPLVNSLVFLVMVWGGKERERKKNWLICLAAQL